MAITVLCFIEGTGYFSKSELMSKNKGTPRVQPPEGAMLSVKGPQPHPYFI